jgi:cysteine desulfuration protein SufE
MVAVPHVGGVLIPERTTTSMHDPDKAQHEIIQSFAEFSEWLDRYQYLIDLGRKLPPLDEAEKNDEKLLAGCQSRVWLIMEGNSDEIQIRANSDAAIVSGLIALLINVYSGSSAKQILDTPAYFIEQIGLTEHLSPTRANGLHAMLQAIRSYADRLIEASD